MSELPYIDEHSITVDAAPACLWAALGEVLARTFSRRGETLHEPFGHEWEIATHKEDLTPEEIQRRGEEAMASMG